MSWIFVALVVGLSAWHVWLTWRADREMRQRWARTDAHFRARERKLDEDWARYMCVHWQHVGPAEHARECERCRRDGTPRRDDPSSAGRDTPAR